jgi:hypothetical protein
MLLVNNNNPIVVLVHKKYIQLSTTESYTKIIKNLNESALKLIKSPLKITGFPLKITGFPLRITGFPLKTSKFPAQTSYFLNSHFLHQNRTCGVQLSTFFYVCSKRGLTAFLMIAPIGTELGLLHYYGVIVSRVIEAIKVTRVIRVIYDYKVIRIMRIIRVIKQGY